ncbi:MAG: YraN family protein [Acidimicrobiia bacterium]
MDPRRALGVGGEELVAGWYESRGYGVIDRNWRCADGEIDLVIRGPGVLVFCEVKTRTSKTFGVPAEAVTAAKARRIRRLAAQWLSARRMRAPEVRFDVASVLARRDRQPEVDVIEAAF